MRSDAHLNLPDPISPQCSPRVLHLDARNNDKSLYFQLDPTFGNDEVGISIIPCGTSLINHLGQIDNALVCSLEPCQLDADHMTRFCGSNGLIYSNGDIKPLSFFGNIRGFVSWL